MIGLEEPMTHTDDISQLLRKVDGLLSSHLAAELRHRRATLEEWWLLGLLGDGAGHAMSEIAAHTAMPAPSLTRLVDRLVSTTILYRRADDADRRRILVYLTERGWARLDDLAGVVGQSVSVLRDGGVDLRSLGDLLSEIVAALEASKAATPPTPRHGGGEPGTLFTSP